MSRTKRVTVRLSEEEYSRLLSEAPNKLSTYLREIITDGSTIYWEGKKLPRGVPSSLPIHLLKNKEPEEVLDDGTIIGKENSSMTYFFLREGDIGYNILYGQNS